jgi:hypothetical protein
MGMMISARGLVLVDSLQKQEASRLMAARDHMERE